MSRRGPAEQLFHFTLRDVSHGGTEGRGKKKGDLAGKKEANRFSWCERERELLRVGGRLIRIIKT